MGSKRPDGFAYDRRGDEVVIYDHRRHAPVWGRERSWQLLGEVVQRDPPYLKAPLTGGYKRGDERMRKATLVIDDSQA